jgi:soluble lytic murein transglycosylase-like protein
MTDRNHEDRTEHGPFPAPRAKDRPWEASETERGPYERRRAGPTPSLPGAGEEAGGARRWGRRKADVLGKGSTDRSLARRLREPIIGLTLAGLAAPLVNAGEAAPEAGDTDDAGRAEKESDRPVDPSRDLDAEIGDYWAEVEADVIRDQTIVGAVTRYEIDRSLAEKIYDYATKHDIEPDIAYGLVFTESTFRERAVSHVGARGLTQVMPRTARWLEPGTTVRDLYDPDVNLDIGFKYLRQLIQKYDGDLQKALTAYNRGPGTVDRILRRGGNPDNGYAGKVMAG